MNQPTPYLIALGFFVSLMLYYIIQDPQHEPVGDRLLNSLPTFLACLTFVWGINQQKPRRKK